MNLTDVLLDRGNLLDWTAVLSETIAGRNFDEGPCIWHGPKPGACIWHGPKPRARRGELQPQDTLYYQKKKVI